MRTTGLQGLGRRANQRRRLVLKRADIAAGDLRAREAALIYRQGGAIRVAAGGRAERRAAREESHRQSGAAVVLQRTELGIDGAGDSADEVAVGPVHESAGAVAVQVMAEGLERRALP